MAEWVSPVRKTLTYRDQGGGTLESHTAGWAGFTWTTGPVRVQSTGRWGQPAVYAVSEAEGKRVLRHAASLAGYDLEADPSHEWLVAVLPPGRIGRVALVAPREVPGGIAVRWREGPSGRSETVDNGW